MSKLEVILMRIYIGISFAILAAVILFILFVILGLVLNARKAASADVTTIVTTKSIIIKTTRKPGTKPEEFRTHYETIHVPLLFHLAGNYAPLSHTRHYVVQMDVNTNGYPADAKGDGAETDFDSIATLTFRDDEHVKNFMARMNAPEICALMEADMVNFWNRKTMTTVVTEAAVTHKSDIETTSVGSSH